MPAKMLPVCLVLILLGLGPGASASDASKPPIELPFYPQKVGEVYAFDVNIVEQSTYSVDVSFYIKMPSKYSHLFDKESPEDAKRLFDILGGARKIGPREWIEPGVPAKFRIQIIRKMDGEFVLDELVDHPKTGITYMGRYAVLATKKLPPAQYSIRIEYLEGVSELAPLYAKILFARAHHGK